MPPPEEDAGIERWDSLLYRASWMPNLAITQNICLSPAIAGTLDQCGGIVGA